MFGWIYKRKKYVFRNENYKIGIDRSNIIALAKDSNKFS